MAYSGAVKPVTLEYYRKPLDEKQRVFGKPGAGLDGSGLNADRVAAGQKGEKRVAEELERLAARYPNTYVFHSVKLFGSKADIDHVVVQGDKVLLVDSKNWARGHKYEVTTLYNGDEGYGREEERVSNFKGSHRNPFKEYIVTKDGANFAGGKIHLPSYVVDWKKNLKSVLGHPEMKVESVLVLANEADAVWSPGFDRSFWFSNLHQLEYVFRDVFKTESVQPLSKSVLRYFADRVQASVTVQEVESARSEKYFAYQVDRQPGSGSNALMFWAAVIGLVGTFFHWWTFIIAISVIALATGAYSVFVANKKREPSYRKRTGVAKFFSIFVIFFLYFAINSIFKGVG